MISDHTISFHRCSCNLHDMIFILWCTWWWRDRALECIMTSHDWSCCGCGYVFAESAFNMANGRSEQAQGTDLSTRPLGFCGCSTLRVALCLMTLFFTLAAIAQVLQVVCSSSHLPNFPPAPYRFNPLSSHCSWMILIHYCGWCVSKMM